MNFENPEKESQTGTSVGFSYLYPLLGKDQTESVCFKAKKEESLISQNEIPKKKSSRPNLQELAKILNSNATSQRGIIRLRGNKNARSLNGCSLKEATEAGDLIHVNEEQSDKDVEASNEEDINCSVSEMTLNSQSENKTLIEESEDEKQLKAFLLNVDPQAFKGNIVNYDGIIWEIFFRGHLTKLGPYSSEYIFTMYMQFRECILREDNLLFLNLMRDISYPASEIEEKVIHDVENRYSSIKYIVNKINGMMIISPEYAKAYLNREVISSRDGISKFEKDDKGKAFSESNSNKKVENVNVSKEVQSNTLVDNTKHIVLANKAKQSQEEVSKKKQAIRQQKPKKLKYAKENKENKYKRADNIYKKGLYTTTVTAISKLENSKVEIFAERIIN